MQRKLAAILAADVVGYSRLMRADETGTLSAMKALWAEVVQPSVRAHRGRVFKLMGDGMLAEFGSVVDAANAAEAMQVAANARAEGIEAEDRRIQLRIGINLGDVVVDGADLYGDGVNIAARLQEVAPVGGIAVSAGTHEYLLGKTAITFADVGERTLKNIDQPVHIWLWPSAGEAVAAPTLTLSRSSQPSIAVLPFQNLSSAPDAEFFADGMTEDVINALSKFRWLFVIARGTMSTYKGMSASTAQVATDLGVRYVLEGSIRQAGQRIRVSVQLVDTEAGTQLWTQRFDRQVDDLFAIQDEITNAIARAIAPEIERFERRRANTAPPTEVDAWLVYQKGMSIATERAEEKMVEAIQYFDRAHELDPKFTPALAMSAITRMILAYVYRSDQFDEIIPVARAKTELALSLDPSDPLAMLANARLLLDAGHHAQALAQVKKAAAVNPNNAYVHYRAAHAGLVSANFDECFYHSDRVLALSPFDPAEHIVRAFQALSLYLKGEITEARDAYLAINNPRTLNFNQRTIDALILMKLDRMEEARASIAEIKAEYPQFSVSIIARGNRSYAPDFINPILEGLRELGVPEE